MLNIFRVGQKFLENFYPMTFLSRTKIPVTVPHKPHKVCLFILTPKLITLLPCIANILDSHIQLHL